MRDAALLKTVYAYGLRRAHEREARKAQTTTALVSDLPGATSGDVATLLASVGADYGVSLRNLDEHLAAHPDALFSGDPLCPVVIVRLAHALRAAGHQATAPACAECGRRDVDLPRMGADERVRNACDSRCRCWSAPGSPAVAERLLFRCRGV